MIEKGYFEKKLIITPDYCDASARMSPVAAFTIFQGIAAEHAEVIGVGGAAMARRRSFRSVSSHFCWPYRFCS